jgi:hypothetical protein
LSTPSRFPYRNKCQLFQFDYDEPDRRWEICVLFQYGQDEQTIFVLDIGFSSFDRDATDDLEIPPRW